MFSGSRLPVGTTSDTYGGVPGGGGHDRAEVAGCLAVQQVALAVRFDCFDQCDVRVNGGFNTWLRPSMIRVSLPSASMGP